MKATRSTRGLTMDEKQKRRDYWAKTFAEVDDGTAADIRDALILLTRQGFLDEDLSILNHDDLKNLARFHQQGWSEVGRLFLRMLSGDGDKQDLRQLTVKLAELWTWEGVGLDIWNATPQASANPAANEEADRHIARVLKSLATIGREVGISETAHGN
ncbi:MAG: hypothetical protein KDB68_17685 [Planctomycetes bacterium]|nr:hypothetical protein [Planctomycetota bacterium]